MNEQLRCHVGSRFETSKYRAENHFQNYRCIFEQQLCLLGGFCGISYVLLCKWLRFEKSKLPFIRSSVNPVVGTILMERVFRQSFRIGVLSPRSRLLTGTTVHARRILYIHFLKREDYASTISWG